MQYVSNVFNIFYVHVYELRFILLIVSSILMFMCLNYV